MTVCAIAEEDANAVSKRPAHNLQFQGGGVGLVDSSIGELARH